ncbi:FixH family protein [Nitrincola alkalilacustris]|uniref:FixH family protein n=1 Tax=Nitrincola alkalilacustris TaxID=1571224 RepID=UPI00145717FF|nr:FixH family protein [Nitrincola alkalilacustris]
MTQDTAPVAPWYKQFWLWFVLTPIFCVMIYATSFAVIAVKTSDGIVREDHFRYARGTYVDTSKEMRAVELDLKGEMVLDNDSGRIELDLGGLLPEGTEQLSLSIIHPTHQKFDQQITLTAANQPNLFEGTLSSALQGKRYFILEPENVEWRLRTEAYPPYEARSLIFSAL